MEEELARRHDAAGPYRELAAGPVVEAQTGMRKGDAVDHDLVDDTDASAGKRGDGLNKGRHVAGA